MSWQHSVKCHNNSFGTVGNTKASKIIEFHPPYGIYKNGLLYTYETPEAPLEYLLRV